MAANEERKAIVPGFYADPMRNGYHVIEIAEHPRTTERVVVYRPIQNQGNTIGKAFYLSIGEFQSLVDPKKGFKYFAKLPRKLGPGRSLVDPGSDTDTTA